MFASLRAPFASDSTVADYNAPSCEHGVGRLQLYQRDGTRAHSGREFLEPLLGPGAKATALQLEPQSYVTKLRLDSTSGGGGVRATGVEYIDSSGRQCAAEARVKTIVAAGAFASPAPSPSSV